MFKIGDRPIGREHRPYIVAEMSANHLGQDHRALEIIRMAAYVGADAVKIQLFDPTRLARARGGTDKILTDGPWQGRTLLDLYSECAFHFDWLGPCKILADQLGIALFASVFDPQDLSLVEFHDLPAVKISSFDCTNDRLIIEACRLGKPMLISTGMATITEAAHAVSLPKACGLDVVALHCVSAYPTPMVKANIGRIEELAYYLQCPVGYSDHCDGVVASVGAVALGACVIEKHVTLSRLDGGPDAPFSLEPMELQALVNACHEAWEATLDVEEDLAPYADLRVQAAAET